LVQTTSVTRCRVISLSSSCMSSCIMLSFFFFSSRRRHTRFSRDWSSDVCSSDLCEYRDRSDVSGKFGHDKPGLPKPGGEYSVATYFALRVRPVSDRGRILGGVHEDRRLQADSLQRQHPTVLT